MEFSGFPEFQRNHWNYRNHLQLRGFSAYTFAFEIGYDPDSYYGRCTTGFTHEQRAWRPPTGLESGYQPPQLMLTLSKKM